MAKNKTTSRGSIPSSTQNAGKPNPAVKLSDASDKTPTFVSPKPTPRKEVEKKAAAEFIFGDINYRWMLIGIGVLILGFILMSGTTDIMSNTKIILAPFLVLVGFGIEFYAILVNPAKTA